MSDTQVYVPTLSTGTAIDNELVITGAGSVYRQRVATVPDGYSIQVDYNGGLNATYIGYAVPGTVTSASGWQIRFVTYDGNNNPLTITYANGSMGFSFIWANRAGYSYS